MSRTVLDPIEIDNAREFLSATSSIGPIFGERPIDEVWLFRGQGADYPLVPSAFRDDGKLARQANLPVNNWKDRLIAERNVLQSFFDTADRRGLELPDDSQEFRKKIEILMSARGDEFGATGWPDWIAAPQLLSLTALAQHYGVPTRLLDWSRHALTATFFAAHDALMDLEKAKAAGVPADPDAKMVLWAFHFPFFGKQDMIVEFAPIRVVTAPSASNPNLKAQQGVFTMVSPHDSDETGARYRPLDEVLKGLERSGPPINTASEIGYSSRLQKFTLPQSESPELLRLLQRLDISPSRVYPGYGGVVDDLELQARLRLFP